ncbi:hypothetical protein GCK32_022634 [Trichostrongylus colubriformis]|uniref:Uncharacterized protein n=1 Tax=Trichostrongylus colubriformis TaxID=6319 RepID=A0AAN8J1A1_TRICO
MCSEKRVVEIGRVAEVLHIRFVDPRKQFWWYDTMSLRPKQPMLKYTGSVQPFIVPRVNMHEVIMYSSSTEDFLIIINS